MLLATTQDLSVEHSSGVIRTAALVLLATTQDLSVEHSFGVTCTAALVLLATHSSSAYNIACCSLGIIKESKQREHLVSRFPSQHLQNTKSHTHTHSLKLTHKHTHSHAHAPAPTPLPAAPKWLQWHQSWRWRGASRWGTSIHCVQWWLRT